MKKTYMDAAIQVVEAVFSYLKQHPEELVHVAKNAVGLRFGVPMAALRWLAGKAKGRKAPKDIEISAVPPGVRVAASFELMGTPLRASAEVYVEKVALERERFLLDIRLSKVSLKVLDDKVESPLAALLKSGALDLSKPGNLVAYMPKRPPILVEARDDRISLDLFRHPKLAKDPRLSRLVRLIAPLVTVSAIETDSEHFEVALRALPGGVRPAIESVRSAFTATTT
ncbi:MAG: hypothetical protein ACOY0T_40585 [Myxococcota bacterium]